MPLKFTAKGEICLSAWIEGSNIKFSVSDTGIGIPKEKIDIIFDRFRQVDESIARDFGGTGIGLSISKQLIELLQGKISVESIVNHGSCFTIELPVFFEFVKPGLSVIHNENYFDFESKRILIAEDDDVCFGLLEAFLKSTKCEIIRAKNGREAFLYYMENSESLDLILMDINMPVMNGIETVKLIRKENSKIPIIAQTAYAYDEERKQALLAGYDEIIVKPIDRVLLLDRMSFLFIQYSKSEQVDFVS